MMSDTDNTAVLNFLPPLQGKHTRVGVVTVQLAALSGLSRSAVLRRVQESDPLRRLERETLVAVVRGFLRAGDQDAADAVLLCLIRRVGGVLKAKIAGWAGLTPEDKTDAERQMITLLCEKVCDLRPGAEFWECNFATCLNRRLISLWHALTDNALPTVPNTMETSDGEPRDRLEQYADLTDTFQNAELQDVVALVSGGSLKKSQALFMKLSDFSDEEIAEQLGVTTRTLRNWAGEARTAWKRMQREEFIPSLPPALY